MANPQQITIRFFLHGFLGLPSDWENQSLLPQADLFKAVATEFEQKNIDYFAEQFNLESLLSESNQVKSKNLIIDIGIDYLKLIPFKNDQRAWAKELIEWITTTKDRLIVALKDQKKDQLIFNFEFIGYSLGGRLGLAILNLKPNLFDVWNFISTNPGLVNEAEKKQRKQADVEWAKKFQLMDWNELMQLWQQQEVFKYDQLIERRESDFRRQQLSQILEYWSLGFQNNYSDLILHHSNIIQWYVGEKDRKFKEMAENLKKQSDSFCLNILPHRGHRCFFVSRFE